MSANFVHASGDLYATGKLAGHHEIFMFTDNTMAKAIHYHGITNNGK
jgi:hypothetical protein